MKRTLAVSALLVCSVSAFVWGAVQQATLINTKLQASDQSAYMQYATGIAELGCDYVGDRNRMPVYPALMSLLYRPGLSDQAYFARGKRVGIAIALLVLCTVYAVLRRAAEPRDALVATHVVGFTVLAYKAPYFQADVLFYGLTLWLFALLLLLLLRPSPWVALLAGVTAGVAHLTKASVLPALLLAMFLLTARGLLRLRRHALRDRETHAPLLASAVLAVAFVVTVFPYLQTSKQRFGHYFYNVNSTFYVWYDSWAEVKAGTRAHGDRQGWPDMPADQLPSAQKYFREHSAGQVARRFGLGYIKLGRVVARSYGYAYFLAFYAFALLGLYVQNPGLWRPALRSLPRSTWLFVLGYFAGYLTLYAWYTRIAGGNRFVLALLFPLMLCGLHALAYADAQGARFRVLGRRPGPAVISWAVLLGLLAYVLFWFPERVSRMYGGG